jgi:hypothetical protein
MPRKRGPNSGVMGSSGPFFARVYRAACPLHTPRARHWRSRMAHGSSTALRATASGQAGISEPQTVGRHKGSNRVLVCRRPSQCHLQRPRHHPCFALNLPRCNSPCPAARKLGPRSQVRQADGVLPLRCCRKIVKLQPPHHMRACISWAPVMIWCLVMPMHCTEPVGLPSNM